LVAVGKAFVEIAIVETGPDADRTHPQRGKALLVGHRQRRVEQPLSTLMASLVGASPGIPAARQHHHLLPLPSPLFW